jgi:hypothetical protein
MNGFDRKNSGQDIGTNGWPQNISWPSKSGDPVGN